MTLQNGISQEPFYCLLSPRFSFVKTGHFYWYTLAYEQALEQLGLDHFVITPILDNSDFSSRKPTWKEIPTKAQWGNDAGHANPLMLARRISSIIGQIDRHRPVILFSFESSFSLIVALIIVSKKFRNLQIAINLLDSGFWARIFSPGNFIKNFFRSIFKHAINSFEGRFVLFGNSRENSSKLSSMLRMQIYEFPLPSITSLAQLQPSNKENIERQIIVFISKNEFALMQSFVDTFILSDLIDVWDLVIHCKEKSTYESLASSIPANLTKKIQLITGFLDKLDYEALINSASVALIPYTDISHTEAGSGKAMDALGLGVPIIALEGSHACEMGCRVGACFPFEDSNASSIIQAIEAYSVDVLTQQGSMHLRNVELQLIVKREMGVQASLKKIFLRVSPQSASDSLSTRYFGLIAYWLAISQAHRFISWRKRIKPLKSECL